MIQTYNSGWNNKQKTLQNGIKQPRLVIIDDVYLSHFSRVNNLQIKKILKALRLKDGKILLS